MAEGLEVTIKYRGAKYNQVAFPATLSSEFAILKKDLAHLRVHSPSQKNVRRVHGSFVLHWPTAGTSPHVAVLADSLHMRWFKLCSDDPEALKLREFLSIESITMVQDGVVIRATGGAEQASPQDAPAGTFAERSGDASPQIAQQQPTFSSVPTLSLPVKQPPPPAPPPKAPPTAPRSDRQPQPQPPPLKRRMSSAEEGPSNQVRQKLDMPEVPLESATTEPDQRHGSSGPGDGTKVSPQLMQDDVASSHTPTALKSPDAPTKTTTAPSPPREPGEMSSRSTPNPVSAGPSSARSGPGPVPTTSRPPPSSHRASSPPPRHASPYPSSPSSNNDDHYASRRRDRDVNRLTRELWDTRRHLTAMLAREHVILDDLERLGVRTEGTGSADRHGVLRDELSRLEDELRAEKARRVRAERALSDMERECRAPFVVPALFQAFMSISDLSN